MPRHLTFIFVCAVIAFKYCNGQGSVMCVVNSTPNICGSYCEPTCADPTQKFCPKRPCSIHTRGCRCDDGYLRDGNTNQCVLPAQCSECPAGEALLSCGVLCEGTCTSPFEPEACQHTACLIASCGCDLKNGYVRNEYTKTCVPWSQCRCAAKGITHSFSQSSS